MKILMVEPGPSYSTMDVFSGLSTGLREIGHQVGQYRLGGRIEHANACLYLRWQDAGFPEASEPTGNEVLFHASSEIVQYALLHEVDQVIFVSCGLVHPAVYQMLRRAQVPTAVVMTESPYEDARQAEVGKMVDVIWTNERTSVGDLRVACPRTFYLRHGYDPAVHKPRPYGENRWPAHDVVFVGTLWRERLDLLCGVDWSGIDLGIYGSADLLEEPDQAHARWYLEPYLHVGYLQEEDTVELYSRAKIGINLHRRSVSLRGGTIDHAESMNPRCYQQPATGGALLITDLRKEVTETIDAAPFYIGAEELSDQMHHYLDHTAERLDLVEELRSQIAPHTYRERAAQIISDLQKGA